MRRIQLRPKARRDLTGVLYDIIESAGPSKAEDFMRCAWQTFSELARMSRLGVVRRVSPSGDRELRMWRIRRYEAYLVFYTVERASIRVDR